MPAPSTGTSQVRLQLPPGWSRFFTLRNHGLQRANEPSAVVDNGQPLVETALSGVFACVMALPQKAGCCMAAKLLNIASKPGAWLDFPATVQAPSPDDRTVLCDFILGSVLDDDFVPLVSAIEEAIQVIGDQLMNNPERKAAYREARRMAHDDKVCIEHMEPLAA